jgi:hypothetical protein
MRRLSLLMSLCILALSACSSSTGSGQPATSGSGAESSRSAAATPGAGASCADYWCGTGSAQVTIGEQTYTFSPGGCLEGADQAISFRMGDFEHTGAQAGDWFSGVVYPNDAAKPTISGKIGSQSFILTDASATVGLNGEVTFSGTDQVGGAKVTGTFNCG